MKKLVLSLAITSALGLTACDDTTLADVQTENAQQRTELEAAAVAKATTPRIRVVFNPSAGEISVPNDLLYSGTTDGTLEMPSEVASKSAGEPVDFNNPQSAIGALDGWGTQNSFTITLDYSSASDVTIDANSLMVPGAVDVYKVEKFPSLTDAECMDPAKSGLLCKGEEKLTFGVDYFARLVGGSIAIIPLKPFEGGASYVVALTNKVVDSNGNALLPSSTYNSVKTDINTAPLVLPSIPTSELNATQAGIRLLQTMINNFEDVLEADLGADGASIVYTQAFTVQSAGLPSADPLQVVKKLNGQTFGAMAQADATSVVMPMRRATVAVPIDAEGTTVDVDLTVAMALAAGGAIPNDPTSQAYALYNSANLFGAMVSLPYYLEDGTDALSSRWKAMCDSGATLNALSNEQKAALAAGAGDNHEMCVQLGLADFGVDTARHLTKYNPIPAVQSVQNVPVQITVPNIDNANLVRPAFGLTEPLVKPENGWPVVILQHGVTSKKEDMLAATGILSAMGFVTVAIDHPLHGQRGFVVEVEGADPIVVNASSGIPGNNPTAYLNLQSLLSARDNMRQSIADALKLRLSINALVDFTNPTAPDMNVIDTSNVHYLGHSLGAITGAGFTAVANTPTGVPELDALYKINSSVLSNPGGGVGNFLVESGAFGPLVQASIIYGLGNELTAALAANLQPEAFAAIVQANPQQCGPALDANFNVVDQNVALVCAYQALKAQAEAENNVELLAGMQAGFAQFSFAAQTVIDSSDPTNYASLLKANGTPVLVYEMVGDEGSEVAGLGLNPSDQVVPNSVTTNPLAGTSGFEAVMGLSKVTDCGMSETGFQSIVEFKYGSHSTVLSPATSLPMPYPQLYSAVNAETIIMAGTFFGSNGKLVNITPTAIGAGIIEGVDAETACQTPAP